MSRRDPRLWFPLAFLAAGSLLTVAALQLPKLGRPRPTEPESAASPDAVTNRPDVPPWMKVLYLTSALRGSGLTLAHPDKTSGVCFVFDGPADLSRLDNLYPAEDYADCWRGMLLCMAEPATHTADGDHGCRAGDFYLFGDVQLLARVRQAAEQVHFGPYRGVGRPKTPRP